MSPAGHGNARSALSLLVTLRRLQRAYAWHLVTLPDVLEWFAGLSELELVRLEEAEQEQRERCRAAA